MAPSILHGRSRARLAWPILLGLTLALAFAFPAHASPPQRIISMAPSITEMVYALGMGNHLVGVTRYCDYPPAAREVTPIGGYADPNYEAIVALRPDLVILLTSHQAAKRELAKLSIDSLMTPHETIGNIHKALEMIGAACGVEDKAAALVADWRARTEAVQAAVRDREKPRVLICIGRDTSTGQMAGMYMAGRHSYFDEVLELAGATNAYRDETVAYPQVSAEGVVQLNPDVIIDLMGKLDPDGKTKEEIAAQWQVLGVVRAVKDHRVHVLTGDHALRPGPRYVRFLEELARLLHPGAFEDGPADG